MKKTVLVAALAAAGLAGAPVRAGELVLLSGGASGYQVVIPDDYPSATLDAWLAQVARLVQAAFAANGADLPVARESGRDRTKPVIYLGDTVFARAAGVDLSNLDGWGYVHKVVGRDLVIAGRDHDPPAEGWFYHRLGTAKAAADFLRQYAGTRFLYPEATGNIRPETNPAVIGRVDFAASPAFEFLPAPTISVPADLDVRHEPMLINNSGPNRMTFYDIANNMFPRVDLALLGHTWDKAVPRAQYAESNPEYFALRGGRRAPPENYYQHCLANPAVRELIYQWTAGWLRRGFRAVNILQPDAFQPCQCRECFDLYGTGDDWSEKIWLFNREIAERLKSELPGGLLVAGTYQATAGPPKSFDVLPDNMVISFNVTGEIPKGTAVMDDWREIRIPAGLFGGSHNWIANLGTRYTPMRTPLFLEAQVKFMHRNRMISMFRDGVGVVYGFEGPAYYVWGRMFDDPEHNRASDLAAEFVEAAFGPAAAPMRRFYDRLYHGIELYANYLGTRNPAWSYTNISGRGRKHLSDPFQLLGFLYPPALLEALENELSLAERAAGTDKVRARLALVRREFDYVRDLARVIHLYHAHRVAPGDAAVYDLLLDAIDARNAAIESYFDAPRGSSGWRPPKAMPGWTAVLFPPDGHDAAHLRLAHNTYQGPFRDTPLNWDTAVLRVAPAPGVE